MYHYVYNYTYTFNWAVKLTFKRVEYEKDCIKHTKYCAIYVYYTSETKALLNCIIEYNKRTQDMYTKTITALCVT